MENEFEAEVAGWCSYCNHEIYVGDNYVYIDGAMYHPECNEIRNRFCDPFDLDEEE